MLERLKHFVLDVDGVMTTGKFIYTVDGKIGKIFGPHDADGLALVDKMIDVRFISADKRGFAISHKRIVEDMGYPLDLVSSSDRDAYIQQLGYDSVVFMADGYYDAPILEKVGLGICPADARREARALADYVTPSKAAEGAVLDACIYLEQVLTIGYFKGDFDERA